MFGNLCSTVKTISLGILCFPGNQVYSQTWDGVGTLYKISSGGSLFNQLIIAPNGNYYVSFYDSGLQKGSVKKYDGTSWSDVGGVSGVGAQYGNYSSLSGDAQGNLYFTNKNSASLEVRKFDGSEWSQLPNAETTNIFAQSSAVSPTSNIPYVFSGASSGSVKKFSNGTWTNVGATGFTGSTNTSSPKIIINNGQIYVSHNGSGLKVHTIAENAAPTDAWTLL
ncbi:hypothetical protein [Chryseobacterium sp.]|uniref:hypothetical protein n=1 Tax=Chryseobacterium sp. TaxID=1871047 RepID=UPI00289D2732|nr:hypothetical protein [Chryseobacterium sp.]